MNIGKLELSESDVFYTLEEGQFNLGDFDKALSMIDLASQAGASAIEFQLAIAEDFYIRSEAGYQIYIKREFADEQLQHLVKYANDRNLEFIATCLSQRLVPKMTKYGCSAFNLNASDINNYIIIDAILETGKPFFVSLPLATEDEISWVVDRILSRKPCAQFALLHGQHSMASGKEWVEPSDTALGYIATLKRRFGRPVGFIDHTPFYWMPAVAVAAGAQIVTKHFTPSHDSRGPDWAICLNQEETKKAIEMARDISKSVNTKDKRLAKGENLDRKTMRRSMVSAHNIIKNKAIVLNDIALKRPGSGMPPSSVDELVGKRAVRDIEVDTILTKDMFL